MVTQVKSHITKSNINKNETIPISSQTAAIHKFGSYPKTKFELEPRWRATTDWDRLDVDIDQDVNAGSDRLGYLLTLFCDMAARHQ